MIVIKIGGSIVDGLHPSTISDIKTLLENEKLFLYMAGEKKSQILEIN